MTSMFDYTEQDAERDAMLYMKECFDINSYSFVDHQHLHHHSDDIAGSTTTSATSSEVVDMVAKHLKNIRFLEFAEEMLKRELLEYNNHNNNNSSSCCCSATASSSSSSITATAQIETERRRDQEDKGEESTRVGEKEKEEERLLDKEEDDEDNWEMVDRYSGGRLSSTTTEKASIKLPLSIPLKEIINTMSSSTSTSTTTGTTTSKNNKIGVRLETQQSRDLQLKQLKKDIERDRLLINSQRVVGASSGLDEVIQLIIRIFHALAEECSLPSPSEKGEKEEEDEILKEIAIAILLKASRTHSGALAFQALQNLIDPEQMMLIPQSSVTPPLNICIRLGSLSSPPSLTTVPTKAMESGASSSSGSGTSPSKPTTATTTTTTASTTNSSGELGYVCRISCESRYKVQRRMDHMHMMMMDDEGMMGMESTTEHQGQGKQDPTNSNNQHDDHDNSNDCMIADKIVTVLFEDFVFFPLSDPLFTSKDDHSSKDLDGGYFDDVQPEEEIRKNKVLTKPDANQLLHNCDHGQVLISIFQE